ncbi:hypothetical protein [Nocardia camponoti]|uniref:Peptidase n=1 Tax=Nocardia camponoti TaxID=1616106 RepID=A0A917VDY4_9NOCA|nr:hypothetical protein [Nocardia camponoti]GGK66423.1 hypothetical protein GCM10011591_43230 [Nocardia camponoti]
MRSWFSANGRLEFFLVFCSVALLSSACVALVLVPRLTSPPQLTADQADVLDATTELANPNLAAVRRDVQPYGPILVREAGATGRALVVAHPGQRADLDSLAQALAPATAAVDAVWGVEWNRAPTIIVAGDVTEFTALTRAAGADVTPDVAAVSLTGSYVPGSKPTDQRIIFNPEARRRVGDDGLATLLRHELTHVATRERTLDGAPLWLVEGYADYVAQHGQSATFSQVAPSLTTRLRAGQTPADLATDAEFTGPEAAYAYEAAWSFCAFVGERYGQASLTALYRDLAGGPQSAATTDRAFDAVLKATRPELLDGWRAWLRGRATS